MKKTLLVYDDLSQWATNYERRLRSVRAVSSKFDVDTIDNERLASELDILRERQAQTREGRRWGSGQQSLFDETDVLVVDIDLAESLNPFLTGDLVSYLVRCFSKCGLIIGLSQYQKLDFDLLLKGEPGSFTDLTVKSDQIANKGLWGQPWEGFRPWTWPLVPAFLEAFESKVHTLVSKMSAGVLDTIGLGEVASSLPESAVEFLGSNPEEVTFSQFVAQSRYGIRSPDSAPDSEVATRIAVARVSKCIEKLILPGQDVLVDAPHLVSRFPSLLVGNPNLKSTWNRTTRFAPYNELNVSRKVDRFRLRDAKWVSRPAWLASEVSNSQAISENKEVRKRIPFKFGFCEDASAFYSLDECTEFFSGVESYYVRRYIHGFRELELDYGPKTNLLQTGVSQSFRKRARK